MAKSRVFDPLDRLDERLRLNRPPKNRQARWVRYGGIVGPWLRWVIATTVFVIGRDPNYFAFLIIPVLAYAVVFALRRLPRRRS